MLSSGGLMAEMPAIISPFEMLGLPAVRSLMQLQSIELNCSMSSSASTPGFTLMKWFDFQERSRPSLEARPALAPTRWKAKSAPSGSETKSKSGWVNEALVILRFSPIGLRRQIWKQQGTS